jgi:hypothetical protein
MRSLSATELLDVWERGLSEPAFRRAIVLLAAACPDYSSDALAELDIGERDRWLLRLREWTFGSQLASVAHCPVCDERLEWTVDIADLLVVRKPALSGELTLELDRYGASFRLPNSLDLAAIANCVDATAARGLLLERCVLERRLDGQELSSGELPLDVADEIVERMVDADPQADMQLDLLCPTCDHRWQALFDIGTFFWSEINAWAGRIMAEVHVLARAYGWREADILNLSAWRRQHYLGLVVG